MKRLDSCQRQLLWIYGGILLAGGLYEGFILCTGWSVPCVLHEWTGLFCPGCGMTRMAQALLHGEIGLALRQNGAVFCLLVVWLLFSVGRFFGWPRWCRSSRVTYGLLYGSVGILAAFGLLRNLPAFSAWQPLEMGAIFG